jgi:hypothetical protein
MERSLFARAPSNHDYPIFEQAPTGQSSNNDLVRTKNGGGEIRTLGTPIRRTTVFETAAFNRSATPPRGTATRLDDPKLYGRAATT